jgi:tRNA dimethylallyltransferase
MVPARAMTGRSPRPRVLALIGPTAAGKTELALALAERHPVDLISLDSAMVYRGMDIGTAKPEPALLARHPHALVDIRDPAEPYSVADFVADADAAVRRALARGRLPVLVGGTMLYLRAFREGLATLPPADPATRAAIERDAEARGWDALHEALRRVDPEAAARIHPNNPQRLARALEVYRVTGRPISTWWRAAAGTVVRDRLGVELLEVALAPTDRAALHAHIAARFAGMLAAGLIEEVEALRRRGDLAPDLPSMRAVGYRQVWAYLDGAWDRAELESRGVAATRQLARRQLTWLRSWPWVTWYPPGSPEAQTRRLLGLLELS